MFRVLCLDGGGIKGAFTASVLVELELLCAKKIRDSFDLIVGTSTGGILALGLSLGFEAEELLEFYVNQGPKIFPFTGRLSRSRASLRQVFSSKLSAEPLEKALEEILGERRLRDAKIPLVIPSYDAVEGRIYLFKTAHGSNGRHDIDMRAADVALATSAAPTYFRAAKSKEKFGAQHVDGGVWANNPAMIGIVEAQAFLDKPLEEIHLLSIGTTLEPFNISQHVNSGVAKWNVGLLSLMMEGQSEAANAQASLLLGKRFHRINTLVKQGQYAMDDGRRGKIAELVQLGRGEAQKKVNRECVGKTFLNGAPLIQFLPA